jgi:hypothetical protein
MEMSHSVCPGRFGSTGFSSEGLKYHELGVVWKYDNKFFRYIMLEERWLSIDCNTHCWC